MGWPYLSQLSSLSCDDYESIWRQINAKRAEHLVLLGVDKLVRLAFEGLVNLPTLTRRDIAFILTSHRQTIKDALDGKTALNFSGTSKGKSRAHESGECDANGKACKTLSESESKFGEVDPIFSSMLMPHSSFSEIDLPSKKPKPKVINLTLSESDHDEEEDLSRASSCTVKLGSAVSNGEPVDWRSNQAALLERERHDMTGRDESWTRSSLMQSPPPPSPTSVERHKHKRLED